MAKNIIVKPLITEKATKDNEKYNRFTFVVDRKADKVEIKNAIESLYGVSVERVNTMIYGGGVAKQKFTQKGMSFERAKMYKKAIITVAEGDTIDFYSNI